MQSSLDADWLTAESPSAPGVSESSSAAAELHSFNDALIFMGRPGVKTAEGAHIRSRVTWFRDSRRKLAEATRVLRFCGLPRSNA